MKIRITEGGHDFGLALPTRLVFNGFVIRMALQCAGPEGRKLPPGAVKKIVAEVNRVKQKYGHWDLVEVQSAGGEYVKITL